ncbi:ATP-dependent DNA helicase Q-like 1 isoform X2 [Cucurbita moschata]|uniref:ATP-dependent DNA helicase Q-like 1 isoform X2 n=1 Tax=Cucurbita moschata TaxID=3662 RepID=A0A6J1FBL8_CUCMO|nr:ATP-dependent DNA helicase Q-like 1 isoform X2 [Cucurbita moschata]
MGGHDMEKERARLRSLAADFGFDEELAQACLEWIINLYGGDEQELVSLEYCVRNHDLHNDFKASRKKDFSRIICMLLNGQGFQSERCKMSMIREKKMKEFCELKDECWRQT